MAPVVGLAPTRTGLKDRALGSLHSRAKEILPPGLAPGLRPNPGLNGYKPFVLLYTTGGRRCLFLKWRNAEGMLPNPQCGSISLARNPGSLVRFTFHWCPRRELHSHCPRFEVGASSVGLRGRKNAPGRILTDTERGLSPLPLRWATRAKWSRRQELRPHWLRSERSASSIGLRREK